MNLALPAPFPISWLISTLFIRVMRYLITSLNESANFSIHALSQWRATLRPCKETLLWVTPPGGQRCRPPPEKQMAPLFWKWRINK
jgi:hypothetical protein